MAGAFVPATVKPARSPAVQVGSAAALNGPVGAPSNPRWPTNGTGGWTRRGRPSTETRTVSARTSIVGPARYVSVTVPSGRAVAAKAPGVAGDEGDASAPTPRAAAANTALATTQQATRTTVPTTGVSPRA